MEKANERKLSAVCEACCTNGGDEESIQSPGKGISEKDIIVSWPCRLNVHVFKLQKSFSSEEGFSLHSCLAP